MNPESFLSNFRGFYYVCSKKKFNNLIKHNRNYL